MNYLTDFDFLIDGLYSEYDLYRDSFFVPLKFM